MSNVAPLPQKDLERQFDLLARQWRGQSRFMSSASDMAMLMPYQRIIGLGPVLLARDGSSLLNEYLEFFERVRGSDEQRKGLLRVTL